MSLRVDRSQAFDVQPTDIGEVQLLREKCEDLQARLEAAEADTKLRINGIRKHFVVLSASLGVAFFSPTFAYMAIPMALISSYAILQGGSDSVDLVAKKRLLYMEFYPKTSFKTADDYARQATTANYPETFFRKEIIKLDIRNKNFPTVDSLISEKWRSLQDQLNFD